MESKITLQGTFPPKHFTALVTGNENNVFSHFNFFLSMQALYLINKYPTMGILAYGSHKGNCFDQGQLIY